MIICYRIRNLKRDLKHEDDSRIKGKLVTELLDEIEQLASNAVRTEEYRDSKTLP